MNPAGISFLKIKIKIREKQEQEEEEEDEAGEHVLVSVIFTERPLSATHRLKTGAV